jgi:tetratricopeptide (TPR) repeat protein
MGSASLRSGLVAGLLALAVSLFSVFSASADEAREKAELDKLFAALKVAPDAASAHIIDQRIWIYWTVPSDPTRAMHMQDVMLMMQEGLLDGALEELDRMVVDYPTYAEAWNKRATVYYMMGNFDASLKDIEKTLELEPRHFGALSGRVIIYLQQGKRALALKEMANALQVHPFLDEANLFPELRRNMTQI